MENKYFINSTNAINTGINKGHLTNNITYGCVTQRTYRCIYIHDIVVIRIRPIITLKSGHSNELKLTDTYSSFDPIMVSSIKKAHYQHQLPS